MPKTKPETEWIYNTCHSDIATLTDTGVKSVLMQSANGATETETVTREQ